MEKIFKIITFGSVSLYFWVASIIALKEKKIFKEENKEDKKEPTFNFSVLEKYEKDEYIPVETVISKFSWLELRLAKKEYPNIELYYLVRKYGSVDFKIMTAEELKKIEDEHLFISPLFKKIN